MIGETRVRLTRHMLVVLLGSMLPFAATAQTRHLEKPAPASSVPAVARLTDPLVWRPSIVDATRVDMGGVHLRFAGIEGPDLYRMCRDGVGGIYDCGAKAANALADWIALSELRCNPVGRDKWGVTIAQCFLDEEDVSAWLVENGWAVNDPTINPDAAYAAEEAKAKSSRRGIWIGTFPRFWEVRHGELASDISQFGQTEKTFGAWQFSEVQSIFGDANSIALFNNTEPIQQNSIFIKCGRRINEFNLNFDDTRQWYGEDETYQITFEFAPGDLLAMPGSGTDVTGAIEVIFTSELSTLLAKSSSTIWIQVRSDIGETRAVRFDIRGYSEAMAHFLNKCESQTVSP